MKFKKVMRDLYLITLDEKDNTTESGFIVKQAWEQTNNTGVIEMAGEDAKLFKKGQHVYFNPYAMIQVQHGVKEQDKAFFIKEADILAVID